MKKYDGGPAFPGPVNVEAKQVWAQYPGVSMRDYFAAHAPITVADAMKSFEEAKLTHAQLFKRIAQMRYAYADAMIAAREA